MKKFTLIIKHIKNKTIFLLIHNKNNLFLKWLNLFCIFSISFLFFYLFTKHSIYWDIFTARDIQRALGWLEGRIHWPGPEMSGGNNLPGPFFYFLLFPLKLFGENTYTYGILWLATWLSLTYTVAFLFLTKIIKSKELLLIFLSLFFFTGRNIFSPLQYAWNPAFAIMFHVLSVVSLYFWRETNKTSYLYLTGLIIAFGMQIHLLTLLHAITVFLFCLTDILNEKRKVLKSLFLFLFLISFPTLLYNILIFYNIFETSAVRKGHIEWFIRETFQEKWLKRTLQVLNPIYIIPPFIFCLFLTFWQKNKKLKTHIFTKSTKNLFVITIIPIVIGILCARTRWYTYFIPVCFLLLFSKGLNDLMPKQRSKKLNLLIAHCILFIILFVLINNTLIDFSFTETIYFLRSHFIFLILFIFFLAVLLIINTGNFLLKSPVKFSVVFVCLLFIAGSTIRNTFQTSTVPNSFVQTQPSYQKLYPLMKKIALETGWSTKEAMKRIYAIGIHPEISMLTNYSMSMETVKKEALKSNNKYTLKENRKKPTGYMIIQHLKQFIGYSKKDWQQYLTHSSLLSDFLRQEIATGKLLIETPEFYDFYWLVPYKITSKSIFIEGFYNTGQPYYWEEPKWLKNCVVTKQFKTENGFFYCISLSGHLQRAGVHINFSKKQSSKATSSQILSISFFGPLIGTADCCSNNYSFSLWSDIKLNYLCNKSQFQHNLPNIGLNYKLQKRDATERGKNFSAPLKLQIPVNCKRNKIKKITLTFNLLFNSRPPVKKKRFIWSD